MRMFYKPYGKTGVLVSAVGFGGMRFEANKPEQYNVDLIQYAFERGINYFDTAPTYCEGKSEEFYGKAFKHMPRDKFIVADKLMPGHVKSKVDTIDKIMYSLDKLQLEYIDFFHVWNLRTIDQYAEALSNGLLDGINEAKELGLVKHVSFSAHLPGEQIKTVLQSKLFSGVLLGMNLLNFPYRWEGAQWAYEHGYGVAIMNPLSGGVIPENSDKLSFLAKEGETPVQAALRFAIFSKEISTALIGFTDTKHIDMACRIAGSNLSFTEEERSDIQKRITGTMNSICTGCRYCCECPKDINVAAYMQLYNNRNLLNFNDEGMHDQMVIEHMFGAILANKGRAIDCIACRRCEQKCTQHLDIVSRMKEFVRWETGIKVDKPFVPPIIN